MFFCHFHEIFRQKLEFWRKKKASLISFITAKIIISFWYFNCRWFCPILATCNNLHITLVAPNIRLVPKPSPYDLISRGVRPPVLPVHLCRFFARRRRKLFRGFGKHKESNAPPWFLSPPPEKCAPPPPVPPGKKKTLLISTIERSRISSWCLTKKLSWVMGTRFWLNLSVMHLI